MSVLRIQHESGDGEARFRVARVHDAKSTKSVEVRSPVGYPVEGRPNSDLLRELRWYLEEFLGYPFLPDADPPVLYPRLKPPWSVPRYVVSMVVDGGCQELGPEA